LAAEFSIEGDALHQLTVCSFISEKHGRGMGDRGVLKTLTYSAENICISVENKFFLKFCSRILSLYFFTTKKP